jgi:hypothetical protein
MLTELIFEHALRVRVKAHNPDADVAKDATTSDDASSTDGTLNPSDATSVASSDTAQGTQSTMSKDPKHPAAAAAAASSSIDVGKISNLVTTDLRNVTNMSDFLQLLFNIPVSVGFCIVFLYVVLGWRYVDAHALRCTRLTCVQVPSSGWRRWSSCSRSRGSRHRSCRSSRKGASRPPTGALGQSARVRPASLSLLGVG